MSAELIGILAVGATLAGLFIAQAGLFLTVFKSLREDMHGLEVRLTERIQGIETRLTNLERRMANLEQSVANLGQRVANLEESVTNLGQRMSNVERSSARQEGLLEGVFGVDRRVEQA